MNLEETMLSEISQTQEDIYCMIPCKHGTRTFKITETESRVGGAGR